MKILDTIVGKRTRGRLNFGELELGRQKAEQPANEGIAAVHREVHRVWATEAARPNGDLVSEPPEGANAALAALERQKAADLRAYYLSHTPAITAEKRELLARVTASFEGLSQALADLQAFESQEARFARACQQTTSPAVATGDPDELLREWRSRLARLEPAAPRPYVEPARFSLPA